MEYVKANLEIVLGCNGFIMVTLTIFDEALRDVGRENKAEVILRKHQAMIYVNEGSVHVMIREATKESYPIGPVPAHYLCRIITKG